MNTNTMAQDYIKRAKRCYKKRGPAIYGYEAQQKPASEIFSQDDAKEALMYAEDIHSSCFKLIDGGFDDER